ncbi:alpha-glucuronidase family glycosyl hydrolase [Sporosarcina sp. ANT_H38]|uniref:alpha-glucuronidase family glycosyl hydrolase n=1 Tax=Sporosarcina sp. ANT_H38 TaxID=2597358 RepID=UPI00165D952E|nr:alpha-glucuronidase family glycosyl hydrolase [Sporosarcina sp. ANT_H38]
MLFIIDKIIYWNNHETILFAVEELRRLMREAGNECTIQARAEFTSRNEKTNRVILLTTNEYHSLKDMKKAITINADGFALVRSENDMWIIGNEPRSILYGVYMYCKKQFGYQWIDLEKETIVNDHSVTKEELYIHEPMFARRGNIIETINDPSYINSLIDWGVKNGQNEYFFTFFLWDEIKSYVTPALRKRDVHVTLGGHSLSYLLREIQKDTNENTLKQDEKLKFFAENTYLQDKVIQKIVASCLENKVITRISLWPEDIGIDEKNASGFLPTYIRFTEKLKEALGKESLQVEVEYIVYNAGLSWNMLEREEQTEASTQVDALYAYWGRDYSSAIDSSEPRQVRANQALQDWNEQTKKGGKSLTVLEYYSDHFMLTELFPPLLTRIEQDLRDYKQLTLNGVLNLIVPTHRKQQYSELEVNYPWKWIHHFNNYVYSRIAWGEKYVVIVEEYFTVFNDDKAAFHEMLIELETLVSQHTKWNVPLFPARVVDPEKVHEPMTDLKIPCYLREVYERLVKWDMKDIESLLVIQTKDNFNTFTPKEMMSIYFYYLKKGTKIYLDAWALKDEQ